MSRIEAVEFAGEGDSVVVSGEYPYLLTSLPTQGYPLRMPWATLLIL